MQKNRIYLKNMMAGAMIAEIYFVLTVAFAPISFGVMQIRVSEALTILPVFFPAAPFGLAVGCLLANIFGGATALDIVLGSLTTFAAGILTAKLKKHKWLAPLPPVILNAITVGLLCHYVYGFPFALPYCMLFVGIGQAIACYGIGMPLYFLLNKNKKLRTLLNK